MAKIKEFDAALPGTAHIEFVSDEGDSYSVSELEITGQLPPNTNRVYDGRPFKPVYGSVSVRISVPLLKEMVGRMFKITSMEVPEVFHKDGSDYTVESIMLHMEEHTECETESPS